MTRLVHSRQQIRCCISPVLQSHEHAVQTCAPVEQAQPGGPIVLQHSLQSADTYLNAVLDMCPRENEFGANDMICTRSPAELYSVIDTELLERVTFLESELTRLYSEFVAFRQQISTQNAVLHAQMEGASDFIARLLRTPTVAQPPPAERITAPVVQQLLDLSSMELFSSAKGNGTSFATFMQLCEQAMSTHGLARDGQLAAALPHLFAGAALQPCTYITCVRDHCK